VTRIYQTKEDGREWFANMKSIREDDLFYTDSELTPQQEGSWQVSPENLPSGNKGQVRLEIGTSDNQDPWKNVEITGYVILLRLRVTININLQI
jgi:hypothetical protein